MSRRLLRLTTEAGVEVPTAVPRLAGPRTGARRNKLTGWKKKTDAGIYAFLPLGQRVLEKLVAVIDEEMAAVGGQKTSLPLLMSSELWRKTGRWESTGPELMRLQDRRGSDFCLAPTQEELYTAIVAAAASSHRDLPLFLYQIGRKYRDEARPRHGLLRSREFTMKDLYSFHATREDALEAYERMRAAYERVFARVGLPTVQVSADAGNIGGSLTHEFHVVADAGEDSLLHCGACGYAANAEKAASRPAPETSLPDGFSAAVAAAAEANGTVGDLAAAVAGLAATVVTPDPGRATAGDATPVVVWAHVERTVNPLALASALGDQWHVLKGGPVAATTRAAPIGDVAHVLDSSVSDALGALAACGADVRAAGQVTTARAGDGCASEGCGGELAQSRGIEVGQIFHLGTKYSEALGASVRGADQAQTSVEMGCYGLGVSRMLAAAVELHHDDRGIRWPEILAPYQAVVATAGAGQELQEAATAVAGDLARLPTWAGEVILDDRWSRRLGYKLADADLIGCPWTVIVGRSYADDGLLEVRWRRDDEVFFVPPSGMADFVRAHAASDRVHLHC